MVQNLLTSSTVVRAHFCSLLGPQRLWRNGGLMNNNTNRPDRYKARPECHSLLRAAVPPPTTLLHSLAYRSTLTELDLFHGHT